MAGASFALRLLWKCSLFLDLIVIIPEIDDVFIRKDLYEGKYKPDLRKEAEFYTMMGDTCNMQTDMEQLQDYLQYITADEHFKIELWE